MGRKEEALLSEEGRRQQLQKEQGDRMESGTSEEQQAQLDWLWECYVAGEKLNAVP